MKVEIKLTRSLIARKPKQVKTAHALGLKRVGQKVVKDSNEAILGMIRVIAHLVEVKEIEEGQDVK